MITITLPSGTITLREGQFGDDIPSQIQTHNLNMQEIQTWLRAIKIALETVAAQAATSVSVSQNNTIPRHEIHIPVNLTDGQNVTDSNGFNIARTGVPSGGTSDSLEYVITDTNTTRNTNFAKSIFAMKQLNGPVVYPTMIPNLTTLRIVFAHNSEMAATSGHVGPAETDPNVKVLTLI